MGIGDYTPNVGEAGDGDEEESVLNDLYSPVPPATSESAGVSLVEEGSADMIPGVDLPAIVNLVSKPTGVDMGGLQADPPQGDALFDDAVFDTTLDDGLETCDFNEPIDKPKAASPKTGMVACNACNRKQTQKYVSSMQGNKYQVALAQITNSLVTSDTSMALAKMFVKLMSKGIHQHADIIGMVMAQVLLKAALKKWGKEAEESVGKEMKQLHGQNSFQPMHWKSLKAKQHKKVLESQIFVGRKHDGILKAQQVAGGNKQQGYITKEDASSPTVSLEAVLLRCIVDANKNSYVAIVDIPNAFIQTIVEDEKDKALICIRGPLVDILVSTAPNVYGPYVTVGKKGKKQLLV